MTSLAAPLTLPDVSRMLREAVKDRSYRSTPLGLEVARYYRWKKNEWGAAQDTLRDYEAILRNLSVYFSDLELKDFEPPVGTERVREAWDFFWSDKSARTRAKTLSVLRDFFKWAVREGKLHGDPTTAISRPKQRQSERGTFTRGNVAKILAAQPRLRDRVALELLFYLGLRKGELSRIQFKHYDGRNLTVFGKGGKVRYLPIVNQQLRVDLERLMLDEKVNADEFLLFPERLGARMVGGPLEVIWQDRRKPMTSSTLHRWWHRCLDRSGVVHQPMHEARHTAITELVRRTGNLKVAQQLAGHASITTTADVYTHFDLGDLATALRLVEDD